MITVKVRGAAGLGRLLGGEEEGREIILPAGSTLRELLEILAGRCGEDLRRAIFREERRELRPGVRPLLNGRDIAVLGGLELKLQDGDRLLLLPPLSGG